MDTDTPKVTGQSRLWTITVFPEEKSEELNWPLATEDNLPLDNPDPEQIQGLFYQVEQCPKTSKYHLQGFVVFKKKVRFGTVKTLFPTAHIEKCRGTQQQNITYCSKSESKIRGPFTVGTLETPGKSKPLQEACKMIVEGKTMREIAVEYPTVFVVHSRGLRMLQQQILEEPASWRVIEVIWYWGKTNVGKTRTCYEQDPKLYKVKDKGQWWDGYIDQTTILFDEFYGEIPMKNMLNWLDGYPIDLEVKGGYTSARWTKVFITSNTDPHNMYNGVPQDVRDAFYRRINQIIYLE